MEVSGRRTEGQSQSEDGEIFCQPCSTDDDWVVAKGYCQNCNEFFCAACLKLHRKQSATRNHVILEGRSMPKSPTPDADVDSCSDLCSKHCNEIVKFFCVSHDTVGCGDCMVLEHKVCKVERIQDISSTYFNSPEHRQIRGKVENFLENLEELKCCIQIAKQDINTTYTQAVEDIKTFRKEVNDYLDRAEADMLAKLKKMKETDKKTMSELDADHQSIYSEVRKLEEKLKLQYSKANALFVAAKEMKDRMCSIERAIKQMKQKGQIQQYWFEKSLELNAAISSRVLLGTLKRSKEQRQKQTCDMVPRFDGEINIKAPEDKSNCFVIATALISPSQIVLADSYNLCLKMFDIEKGVLLDRFILCDQPTDVAVVNENQIAIAIPDKRKIQILSITNSGKLVESHYINITGKVRKLACLDGNFIIAYMDTVEILNNSRKVVKYVNYSGFSWIADIAVTNDSKAFFVSNSGCNGKPTAIYKLDLDGNLLATYKDTSLPDVRGIAVTPDDTLLACNWADNGSIHMVSSECKKIKEVLQQNELVQSPFSVSYCDQTNKLFLCNYKGTLDPKQNNVLKLFQMV